MIGNTATAVYVDTVETARRTRALICSARRGSRCASAVATTPADVLAAAGGADALLVGDSPVTAAVIEGLAGRLRIISTVTVGVDHIDLGAARAAGVWVTNVPDATTEEVAVTALAMALSLVRHVPFLDRDVRAGGWDAFATGRRRRPSSLTLGNRRPRPDRPASAALAAPIFGRVCAHDPATAEPWPSDVGPARPGRRPRGVGRGLAASAGTARGASADRCRGARPDAARRVPRQRLARRARRHRGAARSARRAAGSRGAALDVVAGEPPPLDAPVRRHPAGRADAARRVLERRGRGRQLRAPGRQRDRLEARAGGRSRRSSKAARDDLGRRGARSRRWPSAASTRSSASRACTRWSCTAGSTTSGVRHVTPRHEQGAGFMADGYGACLGPAGRLPRRSAGPASPTCSRRSPRPARMRDPCSCSRPRVSRERARPRAAA